jgi:hypothetical protein
MMCGIGVTSIAILTMCVGFLAFMLLGFILGNWRGRNVATIHWAKKYREAKSGDGKSYYDGFYEAEKLWQRVYNETVAREVAHIKEETGVPCDKVNP